jgi:hypothetical protein
MINNNKMFENMNKSCKFLGVVLLLCLNQCIAIGAPIQPIERSIGKLRISIDPRIELLAAIHSLSVNQDLSNRNSPYSKEIISFFEAFSSQEAVKLTESLQQKYGFSYDAPVAFMLHLSQPVELEEKNKFSDYILKRSGEGENLEQYRKSIKQFAEISNFETFWNSKIPFYNQILDKTLANMGEIDLVKAMEDYFNETQENYNVIITPAFYGGKGAFVSGLNGKETFYATLETTDMQENIPYTSGNNILFYVWHEYGHFFVNPLTEKYANRMSSQDKLYEPIKTAMLKQAYGSWETCVNEHIIRAINIRMVELYSNAQQSKTLLNRELDNRFIYIEPLIEKLKEFEKQRDESHITFSEFYPELLNVLDSLQKVEYWKQINVNFGGTLNAVLTEEKTVWIYPTQDLDTEGLKIAQDYALQIFNTFAKPRGGILLADTTALKTNLSEYGIIAYGTIESNLFLKQYASTFPFKIENQTIYADKEYKDKDIKFISCVPNPQNPEKGMSIYTALSNKNIQGINNVFHGPEDYVVFINRETVISKGFYKKNEKWTF